MKKENDGQDVTAARGRRILNSLNSPGATYPILRFEDVFRSVEVYVINRPNQPYLGTGEGGQGPTAAAIANALANATGQRFRELPFTRERVKTALSAMRHEFGGHAELVPDRKASAHR